MQTSEPKPQSSRPRLAVDETPLSPEVEEAIQTDLAPSMAVAMLAKTDHPDEPGSPGMKCIGVGVSASELPEFVRLQFMFENGTLLPIDVPRAAGESLAIGLHRELNP